MYSRCSRAVLSSTSSSANVLSTPRSARKSIRWSYKAYEDRRAFLIPGRSPARRWAAPLRRTPAHTHPVQGVSVERIICVLPL